MVSRRRYLGAFFVAGSLLAVQPASASNIGLSDVLTINGTDFTLSEPTSGTATLTTPPFDIAPLVSPANPTLVALQEVDSTTGMPLFDTTGAPVISATLLTDYVEVGTRLDGPFFCSIIPPDIPCLEKHGTDPYYVTAPVFGYQFTLTSATDPNGLPERFTFSFLPEESVSGIDLSFVTGGEYSVILKSDVGAPDAAAVPEPASMLLLGTGLVGMGAARRWRNRRQRS